MRRGSDEREQNQGIACLLTILNSLPPFLPFSSHSIHLL